jgi:hypothetical protein
MLKFLRRFRKKFKTACLTAALVTCWQVGQPAKADTHQYGDPVTIKFTGTISPSVQSLSHVFLIFGTGYSSFDYGPWFIKLGDASIGGGKSFSEEKDIIYGESVYWAFAGLYGDTSSGTYIEGVNGVVLGTKSKQGDSWGWYNSPSESDAFNQLLNDAPGAGFVDILNDDIRNGGWIDYGWTGFSDSSVLWNFSNASSNGQVEMKVEIVPEPVSIVLFGTGGLIVAALRRRT